MPRFARKSSATASTAASKKKSSATATATDKRKSSRRTTTAAVASSNTDHEEEEEGENDDEEDEDSTTVVERPRKRTKRESAADATGTTTDKIKTKTKKSSQKSSQKKKKKKSNEEEVKEEEDVTMEDAEANADEEEEEEEDGTSPLTQMTAKKYGRIFTAAAVRVEEKKKQAGQRPNLPLVLVHTTCDLLTVRSLFSLARASRSAYAMIREYGQSVVSTESKQSVISDPLGDDIEFIGSVGGPVSPNPRRRLGQRSRMDADVIIRARLEPATMTQFTESHLRHLVTSLTITAEIDLDQLSIISHALPHLRCLILEGLRAKREKLIVLPKHLRSLSVSFQMSGAANFRKEWVKRLGTAISELEYLNEFRMMDNYFSLSLGTNLVQLVSATPRLRLFHSRRADLICTRDQLLAFPSTLTSLSQTSDHSSYVSLLMTAMTPKNTTPPGATSATPPSSSSSSSPSLPSMRNFDVFRTLKQDWLPLSLFTDTLTAIKPSKWETPDVAWLSAFTHLRVLTINTSVDNDYSAESNNEIFTPSAVGIAETFRIDTKLLVDTLGILTCLTHLQLFVHRLDNQQMESILLSLTSLRHLGIGSNQVTTIACFSTMPHLARQLDSLIIRLSKLPRDEVVHLYSLRWLSSLDISGSFSEPLYARQLFPLKSPTQQQPYLRRFIPRSPNEAVPIPPIDLTLQAAQRTEFNERVQSGQVCSAEMMNSDQLSLILQQLDCKEFSFAARTCRSWRSAASLKSAWSSGNTGRILILEGDSPECVPSIMPQLPLWCYARRVQFYVQTRPNRNRHYRPRTSIIEPLTTVSQLSRLESLSFHGGSQWTDNPTVIRTFLSQLSTRLIALTVQGRDSDEYNNPPSSFHEFPRLHYLGIENTISYIQPKWSSMVELEALKLSVMPKGSWGNELRRLSLTDKFRRLELDLSMLRMSRVSQFLHQLAGQRLLSTPSASTSASASTTILHPAVPSDLIDDSQPAVITRLHMTLYPQSLSHTNPAIPLSVLDPLCHLPRLSDLRIEIPLKLSPSYWNSAPPVIPAWDFSQWTQKNAFQQLERFYYDGPIDASQLHHLAHAKSIRFFTLIDPWHIYKTRQELQNPSWTRPNRISLPSGCMAQWLKSWTKLRRFHLEGIQIVGSELNEFTRVAETLQSFHLHHVSTNPLSANDFSFIKSCHHLRTIELKCVLGLTLSPRHTWFYANDDVTAASANQSVRDRDGDTKMKSDTCADGAVSDLSSSTSLIDIFSSCPELTWMTWCLHPTELDASVEFTLENAKIGRQSLDVRREREWTRERYTLKSKLHDRKQKNRSITIRYLSCYQERHDLTVAEEKIKISLLDPADRDAVAHREEKEALEKRKIAESKKRKAEPMVKEAEK